MNWYGIEPDIREKDLFIKNGDKYEVYLISRSLYDPKLVYVKNKRTGENDRFEAFGYESKGYVWENNRQNSSCSN